MKSTLKIATMLCLFLSLAFTTDVMAQHPGPPHPSKGGPAHAPKGPHHGPGPGHGHHDPIHQHFFPPEMIMHHQSELKLTEDQRKYIIKESTEAQQKFTALKWDLQKAMEDMEGLVKGDKVDEAKVKAQLDKILDYEKQIKHQQLMMMVRIKNKLTAEQQKMLKEMKEKRGKGKPEKMKK